tara:strand:- start:8624 stop:8806 length:183 start_codon:yes stop_codon:yes gene_type:complete
LSKLQKLNKIDLEIPQVNINEVMRDPKRYALDFIELEFAKTVPKFIKAYSLGNEFGKKNK